jgi:uncharacterized repeat protein (TIGR01451 family)
MQAFAVRVRRIVLAVLTAATFGVAALGDASAACAANPCFAAPTAIGLADGTSAANATTLTDAWTTVALNGAIALNPGAYTLATGTLAARATLKVGSNTTITGSGKDITSIVRDPSATLANAILLTNVDPSTGSNTSVAIDNVRIEGLTLGAPSTIAPSLASLSAAGFSNAGIAAQPNVNVSRFFAFDVGSNGHGSAGFSFASAGALSATNNRYSNFIFDQVTAHWNRRGGVGRGIWFTGQQRNIVVTNSSVRGNAIAGIDFNDGASRGIVIRSNQVVGNLDSGLAVLALDVVNPLLDPVPAPPALIDPRTGQIVPTEGITIADNTVQDNGRFGIEAKGANGTTSDPYLISGNTVSVTPAFVYAYSVVNVNNALGNTNDASFGDCRDRAGIVVARLQGVRNNGNLVPELSGAAAPSGVRVSKNTVQDVRHPFNNVDAATVDLIPGGAIDARAACVPAISADRDGFGIVLEGTGNVLTENIVLGNDIGLQLQTDNPNNSLAVTQATLPTAFFDRGTGTPLGANTITNNIFCGNIDFEVSKVSSLDPFADLVPYPVPGNYFGLGGPPAAKLRIADATGFIADPYTNPLVRPLVGSCGPIPKLGLSKSNPARFIVGVAAAYTLTIANSGAANAPNPINVRDRLPPNFQFNSVAAGVLTAGVQCTSSGTLAAGLDLDCEVFTLVPLAPSGTAEFAINVTPLTGAAGQGATNVASVSGVGAVAANPITCASTSFEFCAVAQSLTPGTQADVSTTINAPSSAQVGALVTITYSFTNAGPSPANAVTISASLPPGLTGVVVSDGGSYNTITGTVIWPTSNPPQQGFNLYPPLGVGLDVNRTALRQITLIAPNALAILTTATITTNTFELISSDNQSQASISLARAADIVQAVPTLHGLTLLWLVGLMAWAARSMITARP